MHETADEIALAVIEGKFPGAPDACTEEARQASLIVSLNEPVGGRRIVPWSDPALAH